MPFVSDIVYSSTAVMCFKLWKSATNYRKLQLQDHHHCHLHHHHCCHNHFTDITHSTVLLPVAVSAANATIFTSFRCRWPVTCVIEQNLPIFLKNFLNFLFFWIEMPYFLKYPANLFLKKLVPKTGVCNLFEVALAAYVMLNVISTFTSSTSSASLHTRAASHTQPHHVSGC